MGGCSGGASWIHNSDLRTLNAGYWNDNSQRRITDLVFWIPDYILEQGSTLDLIFQGSRILHSCLAALEGKTMDAELEVQPHHSLIFGHLPMPRLPCWSTQPFIGAVPLIFPRNQVFLNLCLLPHLVVLVGFDVFLLSLSL